MSKSIRILVADDHHVVREGLLALLDGEPDMTVIGQAEDGVEAVERCLELRPDVLLLDLIMPRMSGIEAIPLIRRELPDVRILILTSFAEDDMVFAAVKAGALGYLLKDATPHELLSAIRSVYNGLPAMPPALAQKVMRELQRTANLPLLEDPLTERELEVLKLVARGMSNLDIAAELVVTEGTVRTHVSHILDKLHLANRTQAALYALREGLAPLDES